MSRPQDPAGPGIGSALKDGRRRLGMDVKEAEERTKIRAKYLRALEAEDWEVLPAPAYVRGFLRTYGAMLGLDGELLADHFRRHHEPGAGSGAPAASEPVLQERRRIGSRPPSRGPLIAALALAIVVLVVILGSIGGNGDDSSPPGGARPTKKERKQAARRAKQGGKQGKSKRGAGALKPIDARIEPVDAIQLCLVGDGDKPLIDAQTIAAGATESFSGSKTYRLDLDGAGTVKMKAGGESKRLQSSGKASFEADSEGIRGVDYAGPGCP